MRLFKALKEAAITKATCMSFLCTKVHLYIVIARLVTFKSKSLLNVGDWQEPRRKTLSSDR